MVPDLLAARSVTVNLNQQLVVGLDPSLESADITFRMLPYVLNPVFRSIDTATPILGKLGL